MLFLARHEKWLGMGRGLRHTWHPSPQLPHCPQGWGWAAAAATDPKLGAFFPVDSCRECSGPCWGGAGALEGHLGHERPGVDSSPPGAGSV